MSLRAKRSNPLITYIEGDCHAPTKRSGLATTHFLAILEEKSPAPIRCWVEEDFLPGSLKKTGGTEMATVEERIERLLRRAEEKRRQGKGEEILSGEEVVEEKDKKMEGEQLRSSWSWGEAVGHVF